MIPLVIYFKNSLSFLINMNEITFIEHTKKDLSNSLLVVAFPTVGLISSIAGHHIVQTLDLKEIGVIISDDFSPTTVIHEGRPSAPIRIYMGEKDCGPKHACERIAVIISEFMPPVHTIKPLADSILDWAKEKNCRFVIGLEGTHAAKSVKEDSPEVHGVISTDSLKPMLDEYDIVQSKEGMITGVMGVMLYSAALRDQEVLCLLSKAQSRFPDSRAAANLVEKLDIMLPGIKIDPKPLYEKADEIEKQIRKHMQESKPTAPPVVQPIPSNMYR
jgi:uncharacterized protein